MRGAPTNKEAGRSDGKSPSPLAIAGLAPYAIKRATISFSFLPAAMCSGVFPKESEIRAKQRIRHGDKLIDGKEKAR